MKYKTSFFNGAIIFEDLKRLWGLAAVYFIAAFLTGPFEIMLRMGDPNRDISNTVENFLSFRYMEIQIVFSVAFGILLSMLIYRYLHTINSTTVLHSFPITRKELFNSHNLAGFLLIIVPVFINTLFLVGLMLVNNDGSKLYLEVFTMHSISEWAGKTLLINIVIYLVSTLTAMVTGTTIIHGILSIIFLFLPIGLGSLIMANLGQLVYGLAINSNSVEKLLGKVIPIIPVLENEEIGLVLILWYILLSIILYVSALYFYKKRHLEKATDPISIDGMKPIFKYGATFCGMVLGGAYLYYSLEMLEIGLYIGYIIGGYLGYLIAEILIQKSIWVFKNIKGLLIYSIIIIIAFVGIKMDITGFEGRIPDIDEIQNAYYGYGVYQYRNGNEDGLEELGNIDLVRKLHDVMIDSKDDLENIQFNERTRIVGIAYELKNGRTMYREYEAPIEVIKDNPYIRDIYESEEYKRNYYNIFKLNPQEIDYIQINPDYSYNLNRNVKIIEDSEIKEIIEAMKKDILDETYDEFNSDIRPWAQIMLRSIETTEKDNKDSNISWKKSYENLSEWLKDKGYYERARIMPNDIDYMVVQKIDEDIDEREIRSTIDFNDMKNADNTVEIRDEEEIEYLLNNYEDTHVLSGKYLLGGYFKNGDNFMGAISEERLPENIKDALK